MKVAIISLKGGVGKTFISVNLSAYLTKVYNKKVLLIDLSGETSNASLYTRTKPKVIGGRLWQGIIISPFFHLKVTNDLDENSVEDLDMLEKVYDYIIFDVPPNLASIKKVEKVADIIFLVLNPDYLSIYTNYILYCLLEDKEKIKIILNKYDKKFDPDIISAIFNKYVSVIIPYSKDVLEADRKLMPVVILKENSKVSKAIGDLAYLLTGKKVKRSIMEIVKSILFI